MISDKNNQTESTSLLGEVETRSSLQCHECHCWVTLPQLSHKQVAACPRCGLHLTVFHNNASQKIIALALTSLLLLIAALPYEFLSFSASGQYQSMNILGSLVVLFEKDYGLLAAVQAVAMLILPACVLLGLLYLLLPLSLGHKPAKAEWVVEIIFKLLPWTMAEIFMVGVLVSLIKIVALADVGMGVSFYAYLGFTICMTITLLYVDKYQLMRLIDGNIHSSHSAIDSSKSIQTTWALLLTSILLLIPANLFPIMHTHVLGNSEPSTIFGGVVLLWKMGSYPIAIIIFIASIFVPVAKIVILTWLNYSLQSDKKQNNNERVFWYQITEFVGRWSMIDVFVVAVLVSLIQLGNIMSIVPGHAALAFCAVVIFTMLAAMSFDPRLIWIEKNNQQRANEI